MTGKVRWYQSIVFKLSALYFIVAVIVMVLSGVLIFAVQTHEYEAQSKEHMTHIGCMLRDEIVAEGDIFVDYQKYMLEHKNEIEIPYDFDQEYMEKAKNEFYRAFDEIFDDKVFREDVTFTDFPDDLKKKFCKWYYTKWALYFDEMREWHEMPYIYLVYLTGVGTHVVYIVDAVRLYEGDEEDNRLHLFDDCEEDPEECSYLFATWEAGTMLDGMDQFDNEYGRTYSYYVPVYIDGEETAMACMDMDFIDSNIMKNVIQLVGVIGVVMIAGFLLTFILNRRYTSKIKIIVGRMQYYIKSKDASIAEVMNKNIRGSDEIAMLGRQTAGMIMALDVYMRSLSQTEQVLAETQESAAHDPLTGVMNKLSYDEAVKKEQWNIENGLTDVGIAMVDLNDLKKINDSYGHEKGNIYIKKLCGIMEDVFSASQIYRIGGDEFVIILRGDDFDHREELVRKFDLAIEKEANNTALKPWERVSAAIGVAVYDSGLDASITNVFKRADAAMYERKKEMKAERTN